MFDPGLTAGSGVCRKATAAEIEAQERGALSPPNYDGPPKMTKEDIEQWALDNLGKNMNTRATRDDMIAQIYAWLKE